MLSLQLPLLVATTSAFLVSSALGSPLVENKVAQTSGSWLTGGLSQHQM